MAIQTATPGANSQKRIIINETQKRVETKNESQPRMVKVEEVASQGMMEKSELIVAWTMAKMTEISSNQLMQNTKSQRETWLFTQESALNAKNSNSKFNNV